MKFVDYTSRKLENQRREWAEVGRTVIKGMPMMMAKSCVLTVVTTHELNV